MSRSNADQNQDGLDRWFVQIKGQIVGPMPGDKVLARIISDELTVMSRISQDRKNWKAICNVSFFEELVNSRIRAYTGKTEVVGQMGPGNDDDTPFETSEVNFNALNTKAVEGISEQLDHARQLEELTANIQKLNAIKKEILLKRKTVVIENDRQEEEDHPDDQNVFISKPAKKFSFKELLSGNVRHRKTAVASAVILIGGFLGTFGYSMYQDHQEQVALEMKQKADADLQAKAEYDKAAATKGGEAVNRNATAEDLLAQAETHLKEKNHSAGQQAIKQALTMTLDSSNRARAHAISAAISVAIGDLDQAADQYSESLQHVELYGTLHGAGILNIRRGNYEEAERYFLKALQLPTSNSSDRTVTLVHLFEAAVALDKKSIAAHVSTGSSDSAPTMAKTTAALPLIVEALSTAKSGRDRLLLAKAMGHFYIGNKEQFQASAIELIDEPVDSRAKDIDSDLDDDLAQWQHLVRHCAIVYNQPPISGFGAAFYAACLSRSHGAAQALPFAKYAFTVNGKDSLFGSLYASILLATGELEAAEKILVENSSFTHSSKLARHVMAEIASKRQPAGTAVDYGEQNSSSTSD